MKNFRDKNYDIPYWYHVTSKTITDIWYIFTQKKKTIWRRLENPRTKNIRKNPEDSKF